ncbi:MAG: LysR family transcriptional regulator [Alphaproteobacteria bacterium]|nr:LysR family transcriptional regulator [Alphaproteobacteria bacterium]
MNLHLLRIFYTVAVKGSFSRAAEQLYISQPAVSNAVQKLEHQLDLPLIERSAGAVKRRKGLQLTTNGQVLFDHARGIFALEKAAIDDIHARVGLKRGRLVIGASTTIAGYWLPPYIAKFVRQHPDIDIQVVVGNTQSISRQLLDCQIDIGLVEGTVEDDRIASRKWQDDNLTVVEPVTKALGKNSDPDRQKNISVWILREHGSGTREVAEQIWHHENIKPDKTIIMGSNEAIANAVVHGIGRAVLPWVIVKELVAAGRIRPVRSSHPALFTRPLFELKYHGRPLPPTVKAFEALLR